MPSKALVTGAAGFIGKHVVRLLQADGWEVMGYDVQSQPTGLDCDWRQASILDTQTLTQAMNGIDTVFHLAAYAHLFAQHPKLYDDINHRGTRGIMQAAIHANVTHLIATLSTVALTPMGFSSTISAQTARPQRSALAGPYAQSKWDADAALSTAADSDLKITRLFPAVPIGTGDDRFTAPTEMVRLFLTNPPPAYLETSLQLVPVHDVARAHVNASALDLAATTNTERQYILAGERWPLSRLLTVLSEKTGKPMPKRQIPYPIARTAASVAERLARLRGKPSLATREGVRLTTADPLFDTQAAEAALRWSPSPVDAALTALLEWLAHNHNIK